jgi:hypothetical protein
MVTLETKVWEKDWEYILKGNYLDKMISANNYNFSKKQIIINNVNNRQLVEKYCEKKVKEGIIDCFFAVEDYETEVLNHFDLTYDSFQGGYNYSIAELVGIYKCKTPYLLHFSGDSFLKKTSRNWIIEAIEIMKKQPEVIVANPTWNGKFSEAKSESFDEIQNFYVGYGFSDQAYLIRTDDFNKKIYKEKNQFSERYPKYGGELFEKRVDAFMRNYKKIRITHKNSSYISTNFPRSWFSRKVNRNKIIQQRLNQMETEN